MFANVKKKVFHGSGDFENRKSNLKWYLDATNPKVQRFFYIHGKSSQPQQEREKGCPIGVRDFLVVCNGYLDQDTQ